MGHANIGATRVFYTKVEWRARSQRRPIQHVLWGHTLCFQVKQMTICVHQDCKTSSVVAAALLLSARCFLSAPAACWLWPLPLASCLGFATKDWEVEAFSVHQVVARQMLLGQLQCVAESFRQLCSRTTKMELEAFSVHQRLARQILEHSVYTR